MVKTILTIIYNTIFIVYEILQPVSLCVLSLYLSCGVILNFLQLWKYNFVFFCVLEIYRQNLCDLSKISCCRYVRENVRELLFLSLSWENYRRGNFSWFSVYFKLWIKLPLSWSNILSGVSLFWMQHNRESGILLRFGKLKSVEIRPSFCEDVSMSVNRIGSGVIVFSQGSSIDRNFVLCWLIRTGMFCESEDYKLL